MLMLCCVTALFQLDYYTTIFHEAPVLQQVSLYIFSLFFFSFPLSENIALIVTLVSLTGLSLILKKSHTTSSQRNQLSSSL